MPERPVQKCSTTTTKIEGPTSSSQPHARRAPAKAKAKALDPRQRGTYIYIYIFPDPDSNLAAHAHTIASYVRPLLDPDDALNPDRTAMPLGASPILRSRPPLRMPGAHTHGNGSGARRTQPMRKTSPEVTHPSTLHRKNTAVLSTKRTRLEAKRVQHQDFPGGHPSQYCSGPSALNCGVLMGSGVLALV